MDTSGADEKSIREHEARRKKMKMVDARNLSGGNSERFFVRKRATQIQGEKLGRVEEFYCGNSTNGPQPGKEAESVPGVTSTCVVKTSLSELPTGLACGFVSRAPSCTPLFHMEQNPKPTPCRLISPASNAPSLFTPGDISARHIRPVELPLPLSTTDPPTSPATYAHFNGTECFVGKDTHNAQFKGNDGDTDHDQFNGNDGFDGEGNFDGDDNDGNDDDAAQYNGSDASEVGGVCVGIDSNNVRFHDKDNLGDSVSFKGNYDKNTHSNGNDTLNLNDKLNVNDNFNDKDSNDSQFNNHDNLYDNGIHNNHARFYGRDNFGGSVSLEGNDNKNTHSNDNDNLNFNDNFNFNFNDNFDDKDRNHSQFNDNDNVYGNDTNSDRFPPPPRGRKRRQTTLWASQTGETNTSVSGSLVWLPDENSALKAPEHE